MTEVSHGEGCDCTKPEETMAGKVKQLELQIREHEKELDIFRESLAKMAEEMRVTTGYPKENAGWNTACDEIANRIRFTKPYADKRNDEINGIKADGTGTTQDRCRRCYPNPGIEMNCAGVHGCYCGCHAEKRKCGHVSPSDRKCELEPGHEGIHRGQDAAWPH